MKVWVTLVLMAAAFMGSCSAVSNLIGAGPIAVPANLTAGPTTSTSVSLSWDPVKDAEGYQVFRDRSSSGSFPFRAFDGPATAFTDSALSPGTTYYYRVLATTSKGSSALSEAIFALTAARLTFDSVSDFSEVQGQNNWYYGYRTMGGSFQPMGDWQANDYTWNADSLNSWAHLGEAFSHPNYGGKSPAGAIPQEAIRRFVVPAAGQYSVDCYFYHPDINSVDGVAVSLEFNGTVEFSQTIGGEDDTLYYHTVSLSCAKGDSLDFIVNALDDDTCDSTYMHAVIHTPPVTRSSPALGG